MAAAMNKSQKRKLANDRLVMAVKGYVGLYGRGNIKKYVKNNLGIEYRTFTNRMNDPETFDLAELRMIFDKCQFRDEQILEVFGR